MYKFGRFSNNFYLVLIDFLLDLIQTKYNTLTISYCFTDPDVIFVRPSKPLCYLDINHTCLEYKNTFDQIGFGNNTCRVHTVLTRLLAYDICTGLAAMFCFSGCVIDQD